MASTVYFARFTDSETDETICEKARSIFRAAQMATIVPAGKHVAIKTHFGERGNESYIPAKFFVPLIEEIRQAGATPFFIETSTLYRGQRSNAVDHFRLAEEHGFGSKDTGCPLIFVDGLRGSYHVEVEVGLKHFKTVAVAGDFPLIPAAFIVTHLTGHSLAGLGGTLKNVAMGLASRAGKMRQHEAGKPKVDPPKCTACGTCARWCPADAIAVEEYAIIDYERCIGCGECLSVCPEDAVGFSWSEGPQSFNEKMAEFAYGILKDKLSHTAFLTFLWNTTHDCNCAGAKMPRICPDLGILASFDPVAIDQAAVDLVNQAVGKDFFLDRYPNSCYKAQLTHAEEIGLGSRTYELLEVRGEK